MGPPDLSFLAGHKLEVYSFQGCPDCSRLARWLDSYGLQHEKVDTHALPEAAERLERETGKQAVPFILVDDKTWVRGYHREERSNFSEAKLLAELQLALG